MQTRQVICPHCKAAMQVPAVCADDIVQCGKCKQRFRLPKRQGITADTITSWLSDGLRRRELDDDEPDHAAAKKPAKSAAYAIHMEDLHLSAPPPSDIVAEPLRLVKFGDFGALFEFQAARLRDPAFRCAMPRRCLRCGGRSHLLAHVIIFSAQLMDNVSLEAEHDAGEMRLSEDQIRDLTPEQMLERFPMVPNVPAPANLPMPYWVCDMCSEAGLIRGQIHVNTQTGTGWGRLQIRGLRRAMEFMEAACGAQTKGFAQLQETIESARENPWEQLPSMIQHRVEQWYKPGLGEQYTAYVPDRDHNRTEDGMNGLLISSRRLIYHARLRHLETTVDKPLKLQLSNDAGKLLVKIETPTWDIKHLVLDRDGANLLRRALVTSGFQAVWQ